MFEEVFFRFGEFFAALDFCKTVAAAGNFGRLESEDEVGVVGAVDERGQSLTSGESAVYEGIFFILAHGGSDIYGFAVPPGAPELIDDPPTEVLGVYGIV